MKRSQYAAPIAAMLIFFSSAAFAAVSGDANDNGKLDLEDAVVVLQALAVPRPTAPAPAAGAAISGDANGGGTLGLGDAVFILQALAGLRPAVPSQVTGMVYIPAGSFQMGDVANEGESDERPVHSVTISAFYLDRYEVTKALWDEGYTWATAHGYSFDNAGAGTGANHPVQNVFWYDVVKWLNARSEKEGRTPVYYTDSGQTTVYRTGQVNLAAGAVKWTANGYRLPTEAEWEYAARAGTTTRFYTGACISPDQANYDGGYPWSGCPAGQNRGGTVAVGSFVENPWGLCDMTGNVVEWVWDWYGAGAYSASAESDPKGSDSGAYRVVRGGGWYNGAYYIRLAYRDHGSPAEGFSDVGFRCVLSRM